RRDAWGDPLPPGALFRTGTLRARHDVRRPICYSPDGKMLAGGGDDDTIRLWGAGTGKDIRGLRGDRGVSCLDFSSDGKMLVSGGDQTVRLWQVASGREIALFTGHVQPVVGVVLAPNGTWLASTDYCDIRFWDVKAGKQTRCISAPTAVDHLALSPDGK